MPALAKYVFCFLFVQVVLQISIFIYSTWPHDWWSANCVEKKSWASTSFSACRHCIICFFFPFPSFCMLEIARKERSRGGCSGLEGRVWVTVAGDGACTGRETCHALYHWNQTPCICIVKRVAGKQLLPSDPCTLKFPMTLCRNCCFRYITLFPLVVGQRRCSLGFLQTAGRIMQN